MIKKIISVITLILVAMVAYKAFSGTVVLNAREMTMLEATWFAFQNMNDWVLLCLIPEQILMYYAAGQIYFAFLKEQKGIQLKQGKLTRISLEINFVNHALPSGGVSGLAYMIWRLKEFKVTAGQVSFIHVLRYAISALANTLQTWVAVVIVLTGGTVKPDGYWALWLAIAVALGVEAIIFGAWILVRKQKNIDWLSDKAVKVTNRVLTKISHGRKRKFLREEAVAKFFGDLRQDYLEIKRNKKILWKPIFWGSLYSFFELATYWVVAIALGHPEVLPQIMIAEGVASVVGTVMVTPGGMGGYEGAMIAILVATGVDLSVATIMVIVTRACVLLGTIVSGYGFYQQALMKREDKFSQKPTKKANGKEGANQTRPKNGEKKVKTGQKTQTE